VPFAFCAPGNAIRQFSYFVDSAQIIHAVRDALEPVVRTAH
jgi:hypothetical protein